MKKICPRCKRELPLSSFGKLKTSKDGLQYTCKECLNKHNKDYRSKNKAKWIEYNRKSKEKTKTLEYHSLCDAIGGYNLFILNHTKQGEFKYNMVNTATGEIFNTNNKEDFIERIKRIN